MANATQRLLTADEVAEHLGVPVTTLYNWRVKGRGPRGIKVGKHLRFKTTDLDRWLEDQADPQPAA